MPEVKLIIHDAGRVWAALRSSPRLASSRVTRRHEVTEHRTAREHIVGRQGRFSAAEVIAGRDSLGSELGMDAPRIGRLMPGLIEGR